VNVTEDSLVEAAQQAIGPQEQVLAAGVFQPRGTSGALSGGSLVGGALGLIPGVGGIARGAVEAAGAGAGYAARHGLADKEGVPVNTLLAVTPQHLVAFRAEHDDLIGYKVGDPFATWDRAHIAITVHGRAHVRTFEIEDTQTGEKFEMETPRFSHLHGSVVVKLLMHDEADANG